VINITPTRKHYVIGCIIDFIAILAKKMALTLFHFLKKFGLLDNQVFRIGLSRAAALAASKPHRMKIFLWSHRTKTSSY
jgi:hypothetical protein